jgi:predicted N-acetyltransferase YhbS
MNWQIAPFQPADAPAVIDLWNRTVDESFPLRSRLLGQQTQGDPNFQPGDAAVARAGGEAVGFALTKTFRQHFPTGDHYAGSGAISVLLVRPDWRNRGLGSALLRWGEDRLQAGGARRIRLGAGLEHTFPGVPATAPEAKAFFERRGYAFCYQTHDLIQDLRAYTRPARATAALEQVGPDVIFGPCRPGEEGPLLDFLGETFPGGWWYWTAKRLRAGDQAGLYLMRQAGRVTGFAHLYTSAARVIGPPIFWSRRLGPRYGGLGPIGIAAPVRGRGLGLGLLCRALEHLRDQGVRHTVVDWTTLVDFYAQVGFRVWRTYWMSDVKEVAHH